MKNFTKQNFKTNPLWIRLLIMTFMLLAGSSSAWAAKYVAGSFNGWNSGDGNYELKNNTLTIILSQGTYEWKYVNNGSWDSGDNKQFTVGANGAFVKFDGSANPEISTAYNQSAGTIYYDAKNTSGLISSNKTYFIYGGTGEATRVAMNRVSGTKNLFSASISSKNNIIGWYIFNQSSGYTENMNKWCWTNDNTSTHTYKSAFTNNNIYTGAATSTYETAEGQTKKRYEWSSTQVAYSSSLKVTVENYVGSNLTADAGTITVKKWNSTSSSAGSSYSTSFISSSSTTTNQSTGYLTALQVTVTPETGYKLKSLTVGGTSVSSGYQFELTAATTIKATWELDCAKPTAPQLSVNKKINVCEGKDNTYGYIEIDNYDSYSNCKFYLGSENNEITNNISEGLIGVNVPSSYKVIVKNDCGSTNEATIDFTATNILTPTGSVSISGNSPICSGEKATLTANVTTSNTISSYTWTKNDGSAHGGTLSNSDKTLTTASLIANTSYKVSVTLTNSGCSKTFAATNNPYIVTVNSAPAKPTISSDKTKVVGSETAKISVTNPDNSFTYTLYKDGAATTRTGTSFDVAAGTYQVKATKSTNAANCKDSELSDKIVISSCTPNATLVSATYNQSTGKIDLSGNLTETCDKTLYYGFLWKVKGDAWNTENAISGTGNPYNKTDVSNTVYNQSWDGAAEGVTYVITAYALNASTNPYTWYYDETGIEVSKCITIAEPNITADPICAGSTATLTLNNKQNGVTYTLDDTPIFTDGTTHTVNPDRTTTYTITATSDISCTADDSKTTSVEVEVNTTPTVSTSATESSICEGETKTIKINTNAESIQWYKDGAAIDGETSAALDITEAGTYYAIVSNASGCTNQSIDFKVSNAFGSDITPTITGPASVQSGSTGINYSTANVDDAIYEWELPTGWTFSGDKDGNQITVTAPSTEDKGTIKVKITKNGCTKTATLNVTWAKGYTVYLRRPHAKNETTDYNAWFEKTAEAGPGYIKFGTVIKQNPGATNIYKYNGGTSASAKDPNEVAVRGTEAFTDCEGHVWDAYSIGLDVKDIYFRAPNDKSASNAFYSGYNTYTWSYSQNTPIAEDLYFTMGPKNTTGMTLNKVSKPFEGIEIDALGSTEICSNNMASFAALYLKSNCTGQEITAYAWKFSTDNSSWDDYTTGKGANTNNIRPNKAGYYHLECTLKDGSVGSVVTSNSIHITTTTCSISNASLNNITSNLPIIMVNTGDKAFPSVDNGKHCSASADDLKKKRSVDVKILWNKNGTVSSTDAYSNGANLYYDRKARMNYRGSSSLNFEKKSFAFCPGDEMCGDDEKSADYVKTKKMNMFDIGLAEDKDWVLYAAYVDPSMMRNILAMETYSAMTGKWGVKNQYVELYIDGKYQGVYVFMDKITKNDNRVNIKWKIDKSDDSKSKREFILKFDKTDVADRYEDASGDQKTFESNMTGTTVYNTYDTTVDQRFEIEYPEKEDIEEDYGEGAWADVYTFISGKVNEFEKAIADGDFNKVRNLINYESWADFFILNEFTKNVDAYRASCVFVFKDGKFEAWPLWDYELSFNNTVTGSGKGRGETTGLLIEHSDVYSDSFPAPFWWTGKYKGSNMYAGLLKDPCFIQMVVSRWAEHTKTGGALHPNTTTTKTAAYKAKLDKNGAATREFTKWPIASRGKDACNGANTGYFANGGGGSNTTYANSYSQLNSWLDANARIKGLQTEIDNLAEIIEFGITATADKDETTPWRAVNVKVDAIGAGYTYTVTPAITRGQVIQGDGNLLIYAEELGDYEVTTTLDAKDQCGSTGENASAKVEFSVKQLEAVCPEP